MNRPDPPRQLRTNPLGAMAWLGLLGLLGACDGSGRAASAPARPAGASASATSNVALADAPKLDASTAASAPSAPVASSAPPLEPPSYPSAAIERARSENSKNTCSELVYKRGCSEVRTGRVRVRLNLGASGNVESVEIVKNGIRRDPEVVEACLKKKLPEWKFEPPDGAAPVVELELVFADKC